MDSDSATIRKATKEDYQELAPLCRALDAAHIKLQPHIFSAPDHDVRTLEHMAAYFDSADSVIIVAILDAKIVGYIAVQKLQRQPHVIFKAATSAYIPELFVVESARKKGIAARLAEAAKSWARTIGASNIQVGAVPENAAALALYRKLGFLETNVRFQLAI